MRIMVIWGRHTTLSPGDTSFDDGIFVYLIRRTYSSWLILLEDAIISDTVKVRCQTSGTFVLFLQ